jgi:hypothetical protein
MMAAFRLFGISQGNVKSRMKPLRPGNGLELPGPFDFEGIQAHGFCFGQRMLDHPVDAAAARAALQ